MSSSAVLRPRIPPLQIAPEAEERRPGISDTIEAALTGVVSVHLSRFAMAPLRRLVREIGREEPAVSALDEAALAAAVATLRTNLRRAGLRADLVVRAFALIREVSRRTIGLRHYDEQLIGGLALLKGMVAEMETGDGKTLTATLAAGTMALAGKPVHVVTVNDYLAGRDSEITGPIYRALGLSIGTIVHTTAPDERKSAYRCDITYCCNKELVFDYLRDRMVLGRASGNLRLKIESLFAERPRENLLVMRGLVYAIVDEVDSVLVDEARTPLIISGQQGIPDDRSWADEALALAGQLVEGVDYAVRRDRGQVELTDGGHRHLADLGETLGGIWRGRIRREESIAQALTALHLFRRDEHYLVQDGKVQIVDEYTGRIMADRSWNEGLHQLIERKEDCETTGRRVPLARISYQRFFRRYDKLSGMTGTAREIARELWNVYRLPVLSVPPHRPIRRRRLPDRIVPTLDEKWQIVAERAQQLVNQGQPVLIGTRSVAASETVASRLAAASLDHVVLNAANDKNEAEIIARAGQRGRITVATNMAGRGIDIRLGAGIDAVGGLHIILTERHDARRIDRQLAGRCGRQGELGTYEAILSLEDPLLERLGPILRSAVRAFRRRSLVVKALARLAFRRAQRRSERLHARMRRDLLRVDHNLGTLLSFSGEQE